MNLTLIFVILVAAILVFDAGFAIGKWAESDNAFSEITMAQNETRYYKHEAHKYKVKAEELELKLKRCKQNE